MVTITSMVEISSEVVVLCIIGIFGVVSVGAPRLKVPDYEIPPDCSECGINAKSLNWLIRGGSPVNNSSEYPWMISIRSNKESIICGGAIIDEFYILTAAHCFLQNLVRKVYFQTRDPKNLSHGYPIRKIIIHPRYLTDKKDDIALVRLKKKIRCDEYKNPICLPDADFKLPLGATSMIAGWGSPKGKLRTMTDELHHGSKINLDFEKCVKESPSIIRKKGRALCQGCNKLSPCHGDSGGPLMHKINQKYYAVGITSAVFNTKCSVDKPAVYTDVAKYIDWIKKEIKR